MQSFKEYFLTESKSVPVDWDKEDVQVSGKWDKNTVAEFYGMPVSNITREEVDLDELTPQLAEQYGRQETQDTLDEFSTLHWGWFIGDKFPRLQAKLRKLEKLTENGEVDDEFASDVDEYQDYIQQYDDYVEDPEDWEMWLGNVVELENRIQEFVSEYEQDDGGYDWREYEMSFLRGIPPVTLELIDGVYKILDGNHRITYAQEQDYDTIGAWVVHPV